MRAKNGTTLQDYLQLLLIWLSTV